MEFPSGILALPGPCTGLVTVATGGENHDFLVATDAPRTADDCICRVGYDESTQIAKAKESWSHRGRIRCMESLQNAESTEISGGEGTDVRLVIASPVYQRPSDSTLKIMNLTIPPPSVSSKKKVRELQTLFDVSGERPFVNVRKLVADVPASPGEPPTSGAASVGETRMAVVQKGGFQLFSCGDSFQCIAASDDRTFTRSRQVVPGLPAASDGGMAEVDFHCGGFSPHHPCEFAMGGSCLDIYDLRSKGLSRIAMRDIMSSIRDLDYNPNIPHQVVTGGEDASLKMWDTRKLTHPTQTFTKLHSHWIRGVRFNPYHDKLILTGGGDNFVKLWHTGGDEQRAMDEEEGEAQHAESVTKNSGTPNDSSQEILLTMGSRSHKLRIVDQHESHEDAVGSVVWSGAWVYASAGADGRVVVTQVPSDEKYQILL